MTLVLITSGRKIRLVIDFGNICDIFKVIDTSIVDYKIASWQPCGICVVFGLKAIISEPLEFRTGKFVAEEWQDNSEQIWPRF